MSDSVLQALRQSLLDRREDFRTEKIPSWPGVYLRDMTGPERKAYYLRWYPESRCADIHAVQAGLLVFCLCDREGNRLFADDENELLSVAKPARLLDELFQQARTVNGMGEKASADIAKKSSGEANIDSSSSSPEPSAAP